MTELYGQIPPEMSRARTMSRLATFIAPALLIAACGSPKADTTTERAPAVTTETQTIPTTTTPTETTTTPITTSPEASTTPSTSGAETQTTLTPAPPSPIPAPTGPPVAGPTGGVPAHAEAPANRAPIIALDAGHGPDNSTVDMRTGLKQVERNSQPETDRVWKVTQRVKSSLLLDGYKVVMLKSTKDEIVTFRQRAERADQAKADLAVSIHGDPALPNTGQIYPQKVGLHRGAGKTKTVFSNAPVATRSQQYSEIFKRERQKIEGPDIVVKTNNFSGRAGMEPGTIPMVQLFSSTPWVYNEKRMPFNSSVYSFSIVKAIEAAIPPRRG